MVEPGWAASRRPSQIQLDSTVAWDTQALIALCRTSSSGERTVLCSHRPLSLATVIYRISRR